MAASSAATQILLADYIDTLASLPNELTRSFSDLRELDAVLRTSIESITRKMIMLADMVESSDITPAERLKLLLEIAQDAQHLKMGTEDKIRVSGKACEELTSTQRQVDELLGQIATDVPPFSDTLHVHSTIYPHVSYDSLRPTHGEHNGRRKRVPGGSALIARDAYGHVSPVKKRRIDDDGSAIRVTNGAKAGPKPKDKATSAAASTVGGARAKPKTTVQEPRSPTSVEFADQSYKATNGARGSTSRPSATTTLPKPLSSANNRARASNRENEAVSRRTGSNLLDMVASRGSGRGTFDDDDYASSAGPSASARRGGSPMRADDVASGEPEHAASNYANGHARAAAHRGRATVAAATADEYDYDGQTYDADETGSLEDPGEIVGEPGEKTYCYCKRVSFGQMVGCDDDNCESEWFHLVCLGLRTPPSGTWYCDECRPRHQTKSRQKPRNTQRASGTGAAATGGGGTTKKSTKGAAARGGSGSGSGSKGRGKDNSETNKSKSASPPPPDDDSAPAPAPASGEAEAEPEPSAEIAAKVEATEEAMDLDTARRSREAEADAAPPEAEGKLEDDEQMEDGQVLEEREKPIVLDPALVPVEV